MFCFKEMDTVSSTKDNSVISTEVKTNVAPILQPFTSTEEKSAPFFDVSSNISLVNISVSYIMLYCIACSFISVGNRLLKTWIH